MPLHVSNVALQDLEKGADGKVLPTRVRFRFVDGKNALCQAQSKGTVKTERRHESRNSEKI